MDRTPRQPSDRVLIAGAVEDLPEIHRLLEDLPETAYGQVFVEVALEEQVRILPAPPRVTVSWLVRSDRPSAVPSLCFADHGEALAAAVLAWAGEWCVTDSEPRTVVWIGCSDSPWIEQTRAAVQHGLTDAGQQVQVEFGG
ncbi:MULTISPECIES: SIP domain-containing protein [unclassified Curtobacterium]|jgi:NADPH-dependent ferric siderophore reductase|uniref:SIP domain-containing protein n=1 Tax=unclassified Curtobacterium TaxID=257496 RepID=UPI00188CB6D8|nr:MULTISPECIES: SIP domain-containing protein [unclassified Curtobacterium]MBF4590184.1 SIP domain-containing protein [Curtobacterium sp. VKM Ac-1395]MCY1695360.1 SIP domain-containing protein [Curtobacterium sp. SL109]